MYNYRDLLIALMKKLNLKEKMPYLFTIEIKIALLLKYKFYCGAV